MMIAKFPTLRRKLEKLSRIIFLIELATFATFAMLLFFSSHGDWDFFLSTAEVDRRSWILDHHLPLWSYQFCGGVTRSGDPQSFGLSPLFLPVLAFGPFWGLKIMVLLSLAVGYTAVRSLLGQLLGKRVRLGDRVWIRSCALAFLFGNFFLWHILVGQITVAVIPWALASLAAIVSFVNLPKPRRRHWLLIAFATTTCFAGGFNIAAIFFVLPIAIAAVGTLAMAWPRGRGRRLGAALAAGALGGLLAAPKIFYVLRYQSMYPRTDVTKPLETSLLTHIPTLQLLPTFSGRLLGLWDSPAPYTMPEYSAFSVNAWILLLLSIAALLCIRKGHKIPSLTVKLVVFLGLLILIGASFSLGDQSPFSLHMLLNLILRDSVRSIGRYQLIFSFSCVVSILILLKSSRSLRNFSVRRLAVPWAFLVFLNLITFNSILTPEATALVLRSLTKERNTNAKMSQVEIVKRRDLQGSYMFPALSAGKAVANCYNPIVRGNVISLESGSESGTFDAHGKFLPQGYLFPIVAPEIVEPSASCRSGTYFTQNEFYVDPSCAEGTCFNLNDVNDEERSRLKFNPVTRKYCLRGAH